MAFSWATIKPTLSGWKFTPLVALSVSTIFTNLVGMSTGPSGVLGLYKMFDRMAWIWLNRCTGFEIQVRYFV